MKLVNIEQLPITLVETGEPIPNAPGFKKRVEKPYISIEDIENAPVIDAIPFWWIEQWNEDKNKDFKTEMKIPGAFLQLHYGNAIYYTTEQLLKDWMEEQDGE